MTSQDLSRTRFLSRRQLPLLLKAPPKSDDLQQKCSMLTRYYHPTPLPVFLVTPFVVILHANHHTNVSEKILEIFFSSLRQEGSSNHLSLFPCTVTRCNLCLSTIIKIILVPLTLFTIIKNYPCRFHVRQINRPTRFSHLYINYSCLQHYTNKYFLKSFLKYK